MNDHTACENTDRELYREEEDAYSPSVFVTKTGGIGINVGGSVYVKSLREWHRLAGGPLNLPAVAETRRTESAGCPPRDGFSDQQAPS